MVLRLVATRAFQSFTRKGEHIALCVFLREVVVAQPVGKTDLIAPFIQLPGIVDSGLSQVFRQFIAVMTIKKTLRCFIHHIASTRIDGTSTLQVDT